MNLGQFFTPGQLRVGRRPVLHLGDRARVEQTVAAARTLAQAAKMLGISVRALHYFIAGTRPPRPRRGRPRVLLSVEQVRETLASAPSLIAAARALHADRLSLRRFAAAHGLTWADGRRLRSAPQTPEAAS